MTAAASIGTVVEKRHPVGGIIFGGLGLVILLASFGSPWSRATDFASTGVGTSDLDVLDLGAGSVLYLFGVALLVVLAVGTIAARGTARLVLGVNGLVSALVPTIGLVLTMGAIRQANIAALEDAKADDGGADLALGLQAGPILAGVAVFALALAVSRFTWPNRPTVCYSTGVAVAAVVMLTIPWAGRRAVLADQVVVRDYWFFSLGTLGYVAAATVAVLVALAILSAVLAGTAWWPAAPMPLVAIATAVPAIVLEVSGLQPDASLASAEDVNSVLNTGVPGVWSLVCLVSSICALAMSAREYVKARRRAANTVTVPAL
ncbi:MAG: hypothetical protein GEV07_15410 [Streptosporangiales bacterium]|nr:hypothetical protein [Streptosporangiales bacterium]